MKWQFFCFLLYKFRIQDLAQFRTKWALRGPQYEIIMIRSQNTNTHVHFLTESPSNMFVLMTTQSYGYAPKHKEATVQLVQNVASVEWNQHRKKSNLKGLARLDINIMYQVNKTNKVIIRILWQYLFIAGLVKRLQREALNTRRKLNWDKTIESAAHIKNTQNITVHMSQHATVITSLANIRFCF